jgi:hypothetical protein
MPNPENNNLGEDFLPFESAEKQEIKKINVELTEQQLFKLSEVLQDYIYREKLDFQERSQEFPEDEENQLRTLQGLIDKKISTF